jgi:hypothetical protein
VSVQKLPRRRETAVAISTTRFGKRTDSFANAIGTVRAQRTVFVAVARHYSQLICWQLADSLRVQIYKVTSRAPCKNDFKRKGQLEDAIDSVCRNIAEGFGCTRTRNSRASWKSRAGL